MKHIVHVSTMHSTFDTRIFRNECRSLVREGFKVSYCVPSDKQGNVEGVEVVPIPKINGFLGRVLFGPKKAMKIALSLDGDLYHFHDPELLFVMARLARQGKKVIWDAHETYSDTIYQFNSLKLKWISYLGAKVFGFFEMRFSSRLFKGVVTITDVMAARYKKKGIPTAVVGNFSNIDNLGSPDFSRPKQEIEFVSSGMQFRERGVVEIAEAFSILEADSKASLKFAGKMKSIELEQEIKSKIPPERMNLVSFTGQISWEQLVNHEIPEAEVGFVLFDTSDPNNCNGLPNRFFECWSNGIPVITTAGTQVARITKEEQGGIVIPDNKPESIARAMSTFLENPQLARELGKNAFSAVQTKYSWQVAFNNLNGLYKKVLA